MRPFSCVGPGVRANRLAARGQLQAWQIVVPAGGISLAVIRDAGVHQSHERFPSADIGERDLYAAASGRKLRTAFPTPREHHPMRWIDLDELTKSSVATIDVDTELTTAFQTA